MNKEILSGFLIKAKRNGYAAGNQIKEPDKSYSTRFEEGDFRFHDNWFGGEPFGGREIVSYKDNPCWMMVYYGEDESASNLAIPTLRKALASMPDDFPARGPKILENGNFKYENNWDGNIEKFSGIEIIFEKDKQIYKATYAGGLVDQRK